VQRDLSRLPGPADKRLAVRVTHDALRQIRGGHPWVYDGSITSVSHEGAPGDLAVVFDDHRAFAAIGLWDPESPITLKIIHVGKPTPIDSAFWHRRISEAVDHRRPLLQSPDNTGLRLLHGENDRLPGLVLDIYSGVAVMKIYSSAWLAHLDMIVAAVTEIVAPKSLILRTSRGVAGSLPDWLPQGAPLLGPAPSEPVMFLENGLNFESHPITGQKTGHFLDQRDNRRMVRDLSAGRRVLDVFSCTGGFSVHAAAGGATEVISVDISPSAVEAARRNMTHNSGVPAVAACRHRGVTGDAFEAMASMADRGETYDLAIVDPPSFAQRQSSVTGALRAYRRLTDLALDLVEDGGTLVQASCSSRVTAEEFFDLIRSESASKGVRLNQLALTSHCADHPIGFAQGAYLKALFATVHRGR